MGDRLMASGRKPSILRINTRFATGPGVGLGGGVSVGWGAWVAVGGGSVGRVVALGLGGSVLAAVGTEVALTAGAAGWQALNSRESTTSTEKSRRRGEFIIGIILSNLFLMGCRVL